MVSHAESSKSVAKKVSDRSGMLAYHWNITPAEAREKLEAERNQN
jgi:hypothetical protein